MKFIACQPAETRFLWEVEVQATNLLRLGVSRDDIYYIFLTGTPRGNASIPNIIASKYNVHVYSYPDTRIPLEKSYIPTIKPYLLFRFFSTHSDLLPHSFFYIDSDVVFRDIPNFNLTPVTAKRWYGSDCSSYLGADYINSKGLDYIPKMANVVGVKTDTVNKLRTKSIGAQMIMRYPLASYWEQSYKKAALLYQYLSSVEGKYKEEYKRQGRPAEYVIQKWCAQMWTDLWIPAEAGVDMVPLSELDFVWATDPISKLNVDKIYHNAGVLEKDKNTKFYKGAYTIDSPIGRDFSYVDKNSASYFYVTQINNVKK